MYAFDDDPIFGMVVDVIVTQSQDCLFILNPLEVVTFNKHYNAYEVKHLSSEHFICRHKDFLDNHILSISKSFMHGLCEKRFICLKYHVY